METTTTAEPEPEPEPQPIQSLRQPKCSLGCPTLDLLLRGGVPCGSVTELFGESGAGKTQLCLQLSLSALLLLLSQGGSSSLYLHSEPPFPLRRLRSLSLSLPIPIPPSSLDHVLVRPLHTAHDLLALLERLLLHPSPSPFPRPVKLIVVDSVAALFRSDFDNTPKDLRLRCSLFFRIAARLKECAAKFGAAVVVTNQVVDAVEGGLRGGLWTSGRRVEPALGISWANCVNTRIFLSREGEEEEGGEWGRRRMHVVFAPHLPESSCEFVIRRDGVFGIEGGRMAPVVGVTRKYVGEFGMKVQTLCHIERKKRGFSASVVLQDDYILSEDVHHLTMFGCLSAF